jgi:transposase-like protein
MPDRSARAWRVDETYIRVRGLWAYLYRAVDKQGHTVGFRLSKRRDISAAKQFLTRAIELHGAPEKIMLDGYPATHAALAEVKKDRVLRPEMKGWTSKYFNNLIEQDHRKVKRAYLSDARLQELHQCGRGGQRDRASTEAQERAVRHFSSDNDRRG